MEILVYFADIWSTLRTFSLFNGHFIYFVVFGVYFFRFGMLYQEKPGNPAGES
jgi:hypothetical protein